MDEFENWTNPDLYNNVHSFCYSFKNSWEISDKVIENIIKINPNHFEFVCFNAINKINQAKDILNFTQIVPALQSIRQLRVSNFWNFQSFLVKFKNTFVKIIYPIK